MKQIGGNRSNGKNKPDGPSKTQECLKILDDLLKTDETELPSEIYEKRKLLEKCATWNDQSAGRIDIFVKFIELYTKQAVIQDPAIDRKENYTSIFFRRGKLVYDTDLEDFFMRIILKMVQIDKEKFIQFLDCISCSNIFQARTTLETIKKSLDIFEKKLKMETELPDMLKALKTKIEGFIESSENEKDSLQDFSIYPTSDNFFGSNPKVHNKAYDGFDSSEEQVNCLVKLEQLDFVYDIKKALQKYFTDKLDVRDIFLYHNVCMIPYSFHDPESIMKYEMFLHFEVFACPYWNIVLINDKLTKRLAFESLLFLSSTPQFHHIDAICYSRMPSKIQKNSSKEFIELFRNGIVPVSLIKGNIVPGRRYYMFESIKIWIPSEIRIKAILSINYDDCGELFYAISNSKLLNWKIHDPDFILNVNPYVLLKNEYLSSFLVDSHDPIPANEIEVSKFCSFIPESKDMSENDMIDKFTTLDHEQYKACINFFLRNITLVNGCAGSGKSHLANHAVKLFNTAKTSEILAVVTQTKHTTDEIISHALPFMEKGDILRHASLNLTSTEEIKEVSFTDELLKMSPHFDERKTMKRSLAFARKGLQDFNNIIPQIYDLALLIKNKIADDDKNYTKICSNFLILKYFIDFDSFADIFTKDVRFKPNYKPTYEDIIHFWLDKDFYNSKITHKDPFAIPIDDFSNCYPKEEDIYKDSEIVPDFPDEDCSRKIKFTETNIKELLEAEDDDDDVDHFVPDFSDALTMKTKSIYSLGAVPFQTIASDSRMSYFNMFLKGIYQNKAWSPLQQIYIYIRYVLRNLIDWRNDYKAIVNMRTKELEKIEINCLADVYRKYKVIVMTASYASKYREALERAGVHYMIIEEAGELTEATTISLIPKNLTHLMMIGDYKQLRPSVEYELRSEQNSAYSFDISTFERLVKKALDVKSPDLFYLNVQRRMHPEISYPIRKLICQEMVDGDNSKRSLEGYKLRDRVSFILHDFEESSSKETRSRSNENEAILAVYTALFYLHRGFQSTEITILTLYKGQEEEVKKQWNKIFKEKEKQAAF